MESRQDAIMKRVTTITDMIAMSTENAWFEELLKQASSPAISLLTVSLLLAIEGRGEDNSAQRVSDHGGQHQRKNY